MDLQTSWKKLIIPLTLTAVITIAAAMALFTQVTAAAGADDKKDDENPDINIEVVENIPAADIEEERVPLADSPDTAAAGSARTMAAVWTAVVLVIAYAVFLFSGMRIRKARRLKRAGTEGDRGSGVCHEP